MSHYQPMPRRQARRLWLAEVAASVGIAAVMWAAGRLLEERGEWHGI